MLSHYEHLKYLEVYEFKNKKRYGNKYDGGYVIGILNENNYDCYISAGIGREDSFTRDFMSDHLNLNEFNSFAIDGSIEMYPYEFTTNISFIKKMVSYKNDPTNTNLNTLFETYNNIFLKMDIEMGEYDWINFLKIQDLSKIKQIVIEFHEINNNLIYDYTYKTKALQKLSETHYLVHAHGNIYGGITNNIPNIIELTYIRKDCFESKPKLNTQLLPIKNLDFSNNRYKQNMDYNLHSYPFVSYE